MEAGFFYFLFYQMCVDSPDNEEQSLKVLQQKKPNAGAEKWLLVLKKQFRNNSNGVKSLFILFYAVCGTFKV